MRGYERLASAQEACGRQLLSDLTVHSELRLGLFGPGVAVQRPLARPRPADLAPRSIAGRVRSSRPRTAVTW